MFANLHNNDLMTKQVSIASSKANVSAEIVVLTTRFNFLVFLAMGAYLLLPNKNIKPHCDDPLLRFANDTSLKHNNFHFSIVPRFGNLNIISELLSLPIYLLAVFK